MFAIINPLSIIKEHIKSLFDSAHRFNVLLIFLGIPFLVAFALSRFQIYLNENMIDYSLTSLSVFTGLLFSLLFIIYDVLNKEKEKLNKHNIKQQTKLKLLKQLYVNVSFSILLGFLIIFILLLTELFFQYMTFLKCSSVLFYGFATLFFLTLLQILKRTYILLEKEFDDDLLSL